jgi:hypothetical protein
MPVMPRPPLRIDARRRTFPEARIVDCVLVHGWATAMHHGDRDAARREAEAALARWLDAGLPFERAADGTRLLDPAEALNFGKWSGMHGDDPFYEERFVAQARALVRAFHPSAAPDGVPPAPAQLAPVRVAIALEREFALARAPAGARTLLRLPLPIEDAMCRELAVECSAPPDVEVDWRRAPGCIDARFAAPSAPTLALSLRMSYTARPGAATPFPDDLPAAERALYTRPADGLVRVTPAVAMLAARLAGNDRDPASIVRRFWRFLADELACGVIDYAEVDANRPCDHAIETGWFDCRLGSALLVALCRSRDIPARVVGGYLLYPDSPSVHWWVEVALPERGWLPIDTIGADLSARGRDPAWRDHFFGAVDYRLKSECLPRIFNTSPGFRFPEAWRMLWRADDEATEIGMYACDTGALAYRDRLLVRVAA